MVKESMNDLEFEDLLAQVTRASNSVDQKLEIIFRSKGYFSALQASRLIYGIQNHIDRMRLIYILEPRLCLMTGSEARDILNAFTINTDKLAALRCLKRVLVDLLQPACHHMILSVFPFHEDKLYAAEILKIDRLDARETIGAGGHQGYAALGAAHIQCPPMNTHMYGTVDEQEQQRPGRGPIKLPVGADVGRIPTIHSSQPSYSDRPKRDYAQEHGYPGHRYTERSDFLVGPGECIARPQPEPVMTSLPQGQHMETAQPVPYPDTVAQERAEMHRQLQSVG